MLQRISATCALFCTTGSISDLKLSQGRLKVPYELIFKVKYIHSSYRKTRKRGTFRPWLSCYLLIKLHIVKDDIHANTDVDMVISD